MKYVLLGISSSEMFLLACIGCGEGPITISAGPFTTEEDARAVHVVNKICTVDVADRAGFKITCPQPITWLHHRSFSDQKAIKLDTYLDGKKVDLQVEKVGDNQIVGRTTNTRLRIVVDLVDGRKEVIHVH